MSIINLIAENLVNKLTSNQIINNEDRAVYKYGLEIFLSLITKIIFLTALAYIFNAIIEMVIFSTTFFLLRINAGGYHAKTFLGCFIATILFIFGVVRVLNVIFIPPYITMCILLVANILIFLYAPVDTPNKRLTPKEYSIYRKRSIKFAVFFTMAVIVLYISNLVVPYYYNIGVFAYFIEAITLTPLVNKKI